METIKVGKIVNTRGLRGEVKIVPNTHFIHERFGEGALLYLGEERCEVRVLRSRMEKGLVFAVFERFIFGKLVKKHTARVSAYSEERHFFSENF